MRLNVWRDGKDLALNARLGDAADTGVKTARADNPADQGRLGLALRPLAPQERREAGVSGGLLVEDAQGPAALAGVQPGDVLLAVNGESVQNVEQVRALLNGSRKSLALLIQRDGDQIFVPVRLG